MGCWVPGDDADGKDRIEWERDEKKVDARWGPGVGVIGFQTGRGPPALSSFLVETRRVAIAR